MSISKKLGTILGALVGDATGATLEFYRGPIDEDIVRKAMEMHGGGPLNVAPGQITDDGELTLALCEALKNHDPSDDFPLNDVARQYSAWYKSNPFDIGMTCAKAFGSVPLKESKGEMLLNPGVYMMKKSYYYNIESEANGALMRCTPIPIFYADEGYEKIAYIAQLDAELSHPNEVCQDTNVLYCLAIAYLIKNPCDADGALSLVEGWKCCTKVMEWLELSKTKPSQTFCRHNIGHVKYAFILAFYFLRIKASFEDAIKETLLYGGDTDTNACIVGGMMGAYHGVENIPKYMLDKVIQFDCESHDEYKTLLGYNRPSIYKNNNAIRFVYDGDTFIQHYLKSFV